MNKNEIERARRSIGALQQELTMPTGAVVASIQTCDARLRPLGFFDLTGRPSPENEPPLFSMSRKAFAALSQGARYTVLKGGRAAEKSHATARYLLASAYERPLRVLCLRESQNSLRESVFSLLRDLIEADNRLLKQFRILETEIRGAAGSRFVFKGLKSFTASSIKSFEGFDAAWIEESQDVSRRSLDLLLPTIRKAGSRFYFTLNPTGEDDPIYSRFVADPPPDCLVTTLTFRENPWTTPETIAEAENCRSRSYGEYAHIWLGELRTISEARIFSNWEVQEFRYEDLVTQWSGEADAEQARINPDAYFSDDLRRRVKAFRRKHGKGAYRLLYGIDFGFSSDPSAGVRCFFAPDRKTLYVDHEYYQHSRPIDFLAGDLISALPGIDNSGSVFADSSRPELVQFLRGRGLPGIRSCKKWPGSILDGISFLQGCKIVVHERCENTIRELNLYSYVVDKHTGKITAEPEDRNNHLIDSLRYATGDNLGTRGEYKTLSYVEI